MLRGLSTVMLHTDDLAAARQWYTELLGVEPYMDRGPYIEFRFGDYQHELGLIDARYAPNGHGAGPAGAVLHWHVDDVGAALERLLSKGAKPHQPVTDWGPAGFVTASVVDPFGNILGIMRNPHYLEILGSTREA